MGKLIIMLGALLILSKAFVCLGGSTVLQLRNRNMDQFECEEKVETYIRNHERLFLCFWWLGWLAVLVGAIVQCSWAGIFVPGGLWLTAWIVSKILHAIENHQKTKRNPK